MSRTFFRWDCVANYRYLYRIPGRSISLTFRHYTPGFDVSAETLITTICRLGLVFYFFEAQLIAAKLSLRIALFRRLVFS